uniref:Uncharacterized protein n=1 Tax=Physcomitrium patens TaxID=3218 RepID=A0A2K1KC59_PHYPA|nr:hypothetical protein PHYPA_010546 [Physcomitrium patens]
MVSRRSFMVSPSITHNLITNHETLVNSGSVSFAAEAHDGYTETHHLWHFLHTPSSK